ncbi:MAG: M15 family metallopeptidase [Candidatus Nanopelagicales bacterium]
MVRRASSAVLATALCLGLATAVPAQAGTTAPPSSPALSSAAASPSASPSPSVTDGTEQASPSPSVTAPSGTPASDPPSSAAPAPGTAAVAAAPRSVRLAVPASTIVMRTLTVSGAVEGVEATSVTLWRGVAAGWTQVAAGTVAPTGEWSLDWVADVPGDVRLRASTAYADGTTATSDETTVRVVAAVDAAASGPLTRADVPSSYRNGCPVAPDRLRTLTVNYWDYQGRVRRGPLVVAASAVPVVRRAFTRAFTDGFRIKQIRPVDVYYGPGVTPTGSDVRAMNAGNTSAYNCRGVTGSRFRVSQHSYGTAIDINTFENPYITGSRVFPAKAKGKYVRHRSRHLGDPGVLRRSSIVTRVFLQEGWNWGGFWAHRDWQHFSVNGR